MQGDTINSYIIIAAIIIAISIALTLILIGRGNKDDKWSTIIPVLCAILELTAAIIGGMGLSNSTVINVEGDNSGGIFKDINGDIKITREVKEISKEQLLLTEAKIAFDNNEYKKAYSIL